MRVNDKCPIAYFPFPYSSDIHASIVSFYRRRSPKNSPLSIGLSINNQAMINHTPTPSEKTWAFICHISPLISFLIINKLLDNRTFSENLIHLLLFSRLIFPIVGWMMGTREKSPWIVHHAKSVLNFQLTYSFLFYIPWIIFVIMRHYVLKDIPTLDDGSYDIESLDGFGMAVLILILLLCLGIEVILQFIHLVLVLRACLITLKPTVKIVDKESRLIYPKTYGYSIF